MNHRGAPLNETVLVFAHISDVHLDGTPEIAARTARVMNYLDRLRYPLDGVVVTGDIADHGTYDEYDEARRALASAYPVMFCPGNHDVRRAMRWSLLGETDEGAEYVADGCINQSHVINGVTFAMCDSSIPGHDEGLLDDGTLKWLDEALGSATGPAFVCFHHPPVRLHQPFIDAIKLQREHDLADVIARHDNVVAILCGHAHTAAATTFAGVPVLVAPGVKSSLLLPWESDQPVTMDLPPALAFHILDDDRRLTTHYRFV